MDPGEGWPPITGVISPFSVGTTVLTLFRTRETESQRHLLQTVVAESPQDSASLFSEVVDGVLKQIDSSLEVPATPGKFLNSNCPTPGQWLTIVSSIITFFSVCS